ncbi:hypothetical protein [Candidatus Nitrosotalea sp. TS]|uniref:hypothetical protein n=1 Tax=Candidatus Nitrosotalea sp. TS TaxID=2341020 RepID=UPI001407D45D|nr:hypothetical protein [Candidatus Nitrosotalea sp. TS]
MANLDLVKYRTIDSATGSIIAGNGNSGSDLSGEIIVPHWLGLGISRGPTEPISVDMNKPC